MNSYELSRKWFNFCFENPEQIKPNHSALYFFAIEHCNRLGWKEKFGFPSQMVMEALGIRNWRTYSKTLIELESFGFIKIIEKSKNQYSSNIIALVKNTKANTKALDKALQKHDTKQGQSIDSIIKQYNKEQITTKESKESIELKEDKKEIFFSWLSYRKEIKKEIKSSATLKSLVKKFNAEDLKKCEHVVNNSIENNYQGLFWDNYKPKQTNKPNKPTF